MNLDFISDIVQVDIVSGVVVGNYFLVWKKIQFFYDYIKLDVIGKFIGMG